MGRPTKSHWNKRECEIFNPIKQQELFAWMIDKYDELCNALDAADEINLEMARENKFDALSTYLYKNGKQNITLSFADIENIIGTDLCKSAYNYQAYWNPSPTHILPNTIVASGYKITAVNLLAKEIMLEKYSVE